MLQRALQAHSRGEGIIRQDRIVRHQPGNDRAHAVGIQGGVPGHVGNHATDDRPRLPRAQSVCHCLQGRNRILLRRGQGQQFATLRSSAGLSG